MSSLVPTVARPNAFGLPALLGGLVSTLAFGLRALTAYSSYHKFRALAPHRLADIGLTQADADLVSFQVFFRSSGR